MKTIKICLVTLAGLVLMTNVALGADFILAHEKNDTNVSVPATETHKNLYAVGANLDINGNTLGDLFVLGGVVTINGTVEKDLDIAGGNLNLNGAVGANARIAGGNISINSPVSGDLLVAGGNVTISEKANVAGDLITGSGNLIIDSEIKGKTIIKGGQININGKIDGNLTVEASRGLTFGPHSQVLGTISYSAPTAAVVATGANLTHIVFTQTQYQNQGQKMLRSLFALATFLKLLALLIAGLVLFWLFPQKVELVVAHSHENTLKSFGVGFVMAVVSPVLAFLLCMTVIGFYLGLIVIFSYLLVVILASVFLLFYVGNLVFNWFDKTGNLNFNRDLLIGAVVLLVVSFVPFFGWMIDMILFFIALGSLVLHLRNDWLTR